jgi:hypothetical protein
MHGLHGGALLVEDAQFEVTLAMGGTRRVPKAQVVRGGAASGVLLLHRKFGVSTGIAPF